MHDVFFVLGSAVAFLGIKEILFPGRELADFVCSGFGSEGAVALVIERNIGEMEGLGGLPDIFFGEMKNRVDAGVGRVFSRREVGFFGSSRMFIPTDAGYDCLELVLANIGVQGDGFHQMVAGE